MKSKEFQGFVFSRKKGRGEENHKTQKIKWKMQDDPMKVVWTLWKRVSIRLFLVAGILWMLHILTLFHVWSCPSSSTLLSAICYRHSKGPLPQPQHSCHVPVANDPEAILIPKTRTPDKLVKTLSYIMEDEPTNNRSFSSPLFGGHESWLQREQSFILNSTMKVHCGFMRNGGAEMAPEDVKYVKKCRYVVVSAIFNEHDLPHQPSNISSRSRELFCFVMVVDKVSLNLIGESVDIREDNNGGQWVGIWRLVLLKHLPYDEPIRNGKVPKLLTHRIFPQARYSIWIDANMELIVDPLVMLERYLWHGNHTFAIAQHKFCQSIYMEANWIKLTKKYTGRLVNIQTAIYRYEGMESWHSKKNTLSDVPEGGIIIKEHTELNNLFSCLWFNEVNLFTPRDQLSFGYVVYRLGGLFRFFMFPYSEYRSLYVLHPHPNEGPMSLRYANPRVINTRRLKETRGGLGLRMPYPGNISSILDALEIPFNPLTLI